MLQIKNVSKKYITGDLVQTALDDVSLNLRKNEFVAILGPSGSGKTTLLNIVGGLDRYDSGDLIINGISTKKYKNRDWDSYRNHTIGFVFQSYNLIPHQSVLANVELALTISGISRAERKKRAKKALDDVGLLGQYHKKPNQMSGGQMQRVAIARALVNNPDILLADEPTGALDSETSIQVMELLKEVARDRLVVMVTHNPELAQRYATRIVRLSDGKITDDSQPYEIETETETVKYKNLGKASMSLMTSMSLSFNNLRTKKTRTLLTSFAGSIGIIGIALILSLSNGVNTYINDIQKSTMTAYPVTINAQSIDLSSIMETGMAASEDKKVDHSLDGVYSNGTDLEMTSNFTSSISKNNLTKFKKYLDNKDSEIHKYIGENGIVYSYSTKFQVYTYDSENFFLNTDGSSINTNETEKTASAHMSSEENLSPMAAMMGKGEGNSNFSELVPTQNGGMVSSMLTENYDVVYGSWPENYDEVVLVLDKNNEIYSSVLYQLGILPASQYKELMKKIESGEKITVETHKLSYKDICSKEFYLLAACDTYVKNQSGNYESVSGDSKRIESMLDSAVKLKVVGVVRQNEEADTAFISSAVGYTKALTDYLIKHTDSSEIVKAQKAEKTKSVLNGLAFAPDNVKDKIEDAKKYLTELGVTEKAKVAVSLFSATDPEMAAKIMEMDETAQAAMLDSYLKNPNEDILSMLYDEYISTGTYDDNMQAFGVVYPDAPSSVSIYSDSFESKDSISKCIEDYNSTVSEEDKITYTDFVKLIMNNTTTIINIIAYVLIAFVAVSLIVSSIMIGIITYISVLERTKEIGILRAIGASKRNISQVFNAETFIVGLLSGVIGIGLSLLLLLPINAIIHALADSTDVNAVMPPAAAVILIILSILLTLIGGLIPSKKAAKQDPVAALRSE